MPFIESHVPEDSLEAYSMGKLPSELVDTVEEHLLICDTCQDQLRRQDDFIQAFRIAARMDPPIRAVRPVSRAKAFFLNLFRLPLARPVPMAAALCVCALVMVVLSPRTAVLGRTEVGLTALRGETATSIGEAPAHYKLVLRLDATALPVSAYRVELVSGSGKVLWSGPAAPEHNRILVDTEKTLDPGTYWVRLMLPRGDTVLREYGLRIR